MTIVEMLLGGGGAVALFRWLTARDRLATESTEKVIASLTQQLEAKTREGEERIKTLTDESERRILTANARADAAELASERYRRERDEERARREQAERDREFAEHERDGLRAMVEGLRESINAAVSQFHELESENAQLTKALANARDTEARDVAAGTVENTGPHPAVKLPTP